MYPEASWIMRAGVAAPDLGALREAAQGLDYGWLLVRADYERAVPVVAARLRECGATLPPVAAAEFRTRGMQAEFGVARLHATLEDVVARLAAEGIDVMLLKGAALSRTRYAHRRDRPMGDLDLLLRRADLARAHAQLRGAGWRCAYSERIDGFYDDHHHAPPLDDPLGAGARVELHSDLLFRGHPFAFGGDDLWVEATRVTVGRAPALVPSARHLLLHACIHFAWGHMLEEGAWTAFRDVSILAASPDLDWDDFARLASNARAATCCWWTLHLAARMMRAPVPAAVLARLAPSLPRALTERLARYYAARLLGAPNAPRRLKRVLWETAILPGRSGHGAVRPWDRNETFDEIAGIVPAEETRWASLRRRLVIARESAQRLGELAFARVVEP